MRDTGLLSQIYYHALAISRKSYVKSYRRSIHKTWKPPSLIEGIDGQCPVCSSSAAVPSVSNVCSAKKSSFCRLLVLVILAGVFHLPPSTACHRQCPPSPATARAAGPRLVVHTLVETSVRDGGVSWWIRVPVLAVGGTQLNQRVRPRENNPCFLGLPSQVRPIGLLTPSLSCLANGRWICQSFFPLSY